VIAAVLHERTDHHPILIHDAPFAGRTDRVIKLVQPLDKPAKVGRPNA
jgi:hypothetical protein